MQIRDVTDAGTDYTYRWPSGEDESYPHWIDYRAVAADGEHTVRIASAHGTPMAGIASV